MLCDITDSEEIRLGILFVGLREDLRIKIALISNLTVTLVSNHALLLEQHSKKKPMQSSRHSYTRNN